MSKHNFAKRATRATGHGKEETGTSHVIPRVTKPCSLHRSRDLLWAIRKFFWVIICSAAPKNRPLDGACCGWTTSVGTTLKLWLKPFVTYVAVSTLGHRIRIRWGINLGRLGARFRDFAIHGILRSISICLLFTPSGGFRLNRQPARKGYPQKRKASEPRAGPGPASSTARETQAEGRSRRCG